MCFGGVRVFANRTHGIIMHLEINATHPLTAAATTDNMK